MHPSRWHGEILGTMKEGKASIRIQSARIAAAMIFAFAAALLSPPPAPAAARDGQRQCPASSEALLASRPWEYGPFVNGGFGTANRADYRFLWAGVHAGKVLTDPLGKGVLRGQFELAAELIPLWQAYTPKYLRANCYQQPGGPLTCSNLFPTGGTYTGVSVTPVDPALEPGSRPSLFDPGFRVRAALSGPITNSRP